MLRPCDGLVTPPRPLPCHPSPIRHAGPRSGTHGGARGWVRALTRTGVSCGRPGGDGRGYTTTPLANEMSSCRTPIRYPRWGAARGAAPGNHPHSSCRTPIRYPRWGPGQALTRPLVRASLVGAPGWGPGAAKTSTPPSLPRLRSGAHSVPRLTGEMSSCRRSVVVPDSDPVPTVGRGTGAAPANHPHSSCRTPIRYPRWGAGQGAPDKYNPHRRA